VAVIENHAAICLVHTVIDVITELSLPNRLADDLSNRRSSRGHKKPAGFRENLDRLWKEPIDF
jgi:hypothetical protein